jgi:hypothetical protein
MQLYFLKKDLIAEGTDIRSLLKKDENEDLKFKILRSIYIFSRKKKYLTVIDTIENS